MQFVADLSLDKQMFQDGLRKKALKPAQLRPRAEFLQAAYGVSVRRACQVLTLPRASHRHTSVADEQAAWRMRIRGLAQAWVSYGYRRIHVLLQQEDWMGEPHAGLTPLQSGGPDAEKENP